MLTTDHTVLPVSWFTNACQAAPTYLSMEMFTAASASAYPSRVRSAPHGDLAVAPPPLVRRITSR